jgi:arylsulfatase A-like enzyme
VFVDRSMPFKSSTYPTHHITPHPFLPPTTTTQQAYAGFMAQTDYEIGRVLERINELGQEDNTMVILMIGDNGASGEGSLRGLANEVGGIGFVGGGGHMGRVWDERELAVDCKL